MCQLKTVIAATLPRLIPLFLGLGSLLAAGACDRSSAPRAQPDAAATVEEPRPAPTVDADARPDAESAPPAPSLEALRIPASAFEGLDQRIDDDDQSLAHFYQRLQAVAQDEPGAVARIAFYSVSNNAADWVTSALRHQLQERFGDGGKGFVPIASGWHDSQVHQDVVWEYQGWRTRIVNQGQDPLGRYGLGGVLATNRGQGARSIFGTVDSGVSNREVSRFRLFYQAWPHGGVAELILDDGEAQPLSTQADAVEDRGHDLEAPRGPHQLRLGVGEGDLRLYGVVMENDGPGVVVDALMILGVSTSALAENFDGGHWSTQVRQRQPDLLVFWLGATDAVRINVTREGFVRTYGEVIERTRAGRPEASCLVMSIFDKAYEDDHDRIRSRSNIPEFVEAQRELARAQGCAFFNLFEALGGQGAVARWAASSPRRIAPDNSHFTLAGAQEIGSMLDRALLRGYDEYLAANAPGR